MALPPGRLTRQQIRDLGCGEAGNKDLSDVEAVDWLKQILFDLYTQYEWAFLHISTTVTITGPTFTLPTDFLKPQDDYALKTATVDGLVLAKTVLHEDRAAFDIRMGDGTLTGTPPVRWHADMAASVGRVFPDPIGHSIVATLRYKQLPAEPATDAAEAADVPTFPWHNYLRRTIFVETLRHEGDPRLDAEEGKLERELQKIRNIALPRSTYQPTIPLDPRVFHAPLKVN